MGFRLVPKSVTLNDLERRNDRYLMFFRRIRQLGGRLSQSGRRWTYTVCDGNVVFSDISFMAIFAEVTEHECIIDRHLRDMHPLLDYDASESQFMILS